MYKGDRNEMALDLALRRHTTARLTPLVTVVTTCMVTTPHSLRSAQIASDTIMDNFVDEITAKRLLVSVDLGGYRGRVRVCLDG